MTKDGMSLITAARRIYLRIEVPVLKKNPYNFFVMTRRRRREDSSSPLGTRINLYSLV
jgi:hypothetical protein